MNCVEFRRQLGVDPQSMNADFVRHRAECARCADAADRAAAFERALARALQVEVPAQLADSILLAQTTAERRHRASLRRGGIFFAAAAALVLAVGLIGVRAHADPLQAEVIRHLHRESQALSMTRPVTAAAVMDAFAQRGLALKQIPDGISFVACCPVGAHSTVHLVMPNADDPISVIYVVDQRTAASEFQLDGIAGRMVPLGNGTLILLAHKSAQFDRIETLWRDALI